jgi:hypothetical protein
VALLQLRRGRPVSGFLSSWMDEPGSGECPASAVAVALWARLENVMAEAGSAWVELNLSAGPDMRPDLWIGLTPAQACEVGMTLLSCEIAAEVGAQQKPWANWLRRVRR